MIMIMRIRTDTLIDRYRLRTNTGYARVRQDVHTRACANTRFQSRKGFRRRQRLGGITAGGSPRPAPAARAIDHSMMAIPRRGSNARS